MRRRQIGIAILALLALSAFGHVDRASANSSPTFMTHDQMEVHDWIVQYSLQEGVDPYWMLGVSFCESNWFKQPKGSQIGPFQFEDTGGVWADHTWYGKRGIHPSQEPVEVQIQQAIMLFGQGYESQWSCRYAYMDDGYVGYYLT